MKYIMDGLGFLSFLIWRGWNSVLFTEKGRIWWGDCLQHDPVESVTLHLDISILNSFCTEWNLNDSRDI